MISRSILLPLALLAAGFGVLRAGPVPNQGAPAPGTAAAQFPTPPSIAARALEDGKFEVTFQWKPEAPVEKPGVAGTFNHWNRGANPMTGPDSSGAYKVTLILAPGVYEYKFVAGADGWFADPLNSEAAASYGNSLLRLGAEALARATIGKPGDGEIQALALLHDPAKPLYLDAQSDRNAIVRLRTLRNDVEAVDMQWLQAGALIRALPMARVAQDEAFDFYEVTITLPEEATPEFPLPDSYRFAVRDGKTVRETTPTLPLDLASAPRVQTPEWAKRAIWYQIMVDRFRNADPSNDPEHTPGTGRVARASPWKSDPYKHQPWEKDGEKSLFESDGDKTGTPDMYERLYGGDFQGVIEKLDYLRDLGVTAIYFNPIFESTSAHKYNARSYVHADDGYGKPGEFARSIAAENLLDPSTWIFNESDQKFLELLREAKKRKIRVILDGVFNHLGEDAPCFQDVRANLRNSPYADWYQIESWEPFRASGWAGFGGLPQFAKDPARGLASESLINHIFAVTRRWMDPNGDGDPSDGIDGWRLDVPMEIPKPFWVEWRRVVKSINPDAYIVGEIWDPAEEWLDGQTFDAVMNYQFRNACLKFFGNREKRTKPSEFDRELAFLRIRYPRACTLVLQNLYNSHDTDRLASRLMNPDLEEVHYDGFNRIQDNGPNYNIARPTEEAYQRMNLMTLFQFAYPGAPMFFYGDEVGMFGPDDPFCRNPMWWEDLMPYENPDFQIRDGMRQEFKKLIALRKAHEALSVGEYHTLLADDATGLFVFERFLPAARGASAVVVAVNRSDAEASAKVSVSSVPKPKSLEILHGNSTAGIAPGGDGHITLKIKPVSGLVILVKP